MSLCSSLWVLSLSGCLEHLLIVSGQGIMGRAEWMLSKSWPPRKASASPTQTKSTATLGRRALTDFCASSESGFPRPEWWCASAKGWLSGASWAPCGALASWASSHSSEGKFPSLSPSFSLSLSLSLTHTHNLLSLNWTPWLQNSEMCFGPESHWEWGYCCFHDKEEQSSGWQDDESVSEKSGKLLLECFVVVNCSFHLLLGFYLSSSPNHMSYIPKHRYLNEVLVDEG